MKVVFMGTCSMGPFFISNHLNKNGFSTHGVYQGLDEIMLGDEPTVPFSPNISLAELQALAPRVIGISVDSGNFLRTVKIAQRIKAVMPDVLIGLGGIHPTICPDQSIAAEGIDFICTGEGEVAMLELCQAVEQGADYTGILSMHFKTKDGRIIQNPLRPWYPNLDDFLMDRTKINYAGIFTGLGCKGRCSFCNTPYMMFEMGKGAGMNKYYRKRSVDSILDEVGTILRMRIYHNGKRLLASRSIKRFVYNFYLLFKEQLEPVRFKDDSFLISTGWLKDFAAKYAKRFWYLPYYALGRADEIDEETVKLLSKSGCTRVIIGFEHGDEEYRNKILLKKTTDVQIRRCVDLLKQHKIEINGQWIIGFPGETPAQALKTVRLASEIDDMPQVHIAVPFPKSGMFDMAVREGWITPDFVPSQGIYSDFIFHKGEERDIFRLIYNIFSIAGVKVPQKFSVAQRQKTKVVNRRVADVLLDDIHSLSYICAGEPTTASPIAATSDVTPAAKPVAMPSTKPRTEAIPTAEPRNEPAPAATPAFETIPIGAIRGLSRSAAAVAERDA